MKTITYIITTILFIILAIAYHSKGKVQIVTAKTNVVPFSRHQRRTKTKHNKNQKQKKSKMNDPLNEDLMSLDTSMPLVDPGIYDLKVEKVEIKLTEKDSAPMLKLELSTTAPAKGTKGETLAAGVRVFDNIMLQPTGKATADMVARRVAMLLQAAVIPGLGSVPAVKANPNLLQGAVLRCKVGYERAGTSNTGKSFPEKNVIDLYVKKA